MKPIPLADLERFLVPKTEQTPLAKGDEPPAGVQPPSLLESLVMAKNGELPANTQRDTSHIVDLTDQFIGKSFIITGTAKPEKKK